MNAVKSRELAAVYRELAGPLERLVRDDVSASAALIEDACQIAWTQLLVRPAPSANGAILSWLATTARREAVRMRRREAREDSLEVMLDAEAEPAARLPPLETLAEQHELLARLRELPARQQRFLWLRALGLSYEEIASHTGATVRTVERQLLRARRAIAPGAGDTRACACPDRE